MQRSASRRLRLAPLLCAAMLAAGASEVLAEPPPANEAAPDAIARWLAASSRNGGALAQQVSERAGELVMNALAFIGAPYRRGGQTEAEGFDCSGFTRHVFESTLGLLLPRRSEEQARAAGLAKVSRDDLQPGDLVFFDTLRKAFSHVGIYIGDGKFVHSPSSGGSVRVEDMADRYWSRRFEGARRVEAMSTAAASPSPP